MLYRYPPMCFDDETNDSQVTYNEIMRELRVHISRSLKFPFAGFTTIDNCLDEVAAAIEEKLIALETEYGDRHEPKRKFLIAATLINKRPHFALPKYRDALIEATHAAYRDHIGLVISNYRASDNKPPPPKFDIIGDWKPIGKCKSKVVKR